MNTILRLTSSGEVAGPITGLIKSIAPPHPETPAKQRVTLFNGSKDLDMNIHGAHMHIGYEHVGDVLTIDGTKGIYLSVFPDAGRCLTIRDGATYSFRVPKPGSIPSVEDRVAAMAAHYAFCLRVAGEAMPHLPLESLQPVATTLFIETKHGVKVLPGMSRDVPVEPEAPEEVPPSEPEVPEDTTPPETPTAPPVLTDKQHDSVLKLKYSDFCTKAAAALMCDGTDPLKNAWRDLFIKVADSYRQCGKHPKVWMDLFDEIYQASGATLNEQMDAAVSKVMEKDPKADDNKIHRTVCTIARLLPS